MKNNYSFRIRTLSLNQNHSNKNNTVPKPKSIKLKEKRGIQSLLEGGSKSHYNTFVGYSRIPHKYDHFHERTLPSSAMCSLLQSNPKKIVLPKNLINISENLSLADPRATRKNHKYSQALQLNYISPTKRTKTPVKKTSNY